jgi:hypothetical protein
VDHRPGSRRHRLTNRQDTWRARCGESRTAGSAGGPGKPTGSNPDRAPRSDPAVVGVSGNAGSNTAVDHIEVLGEAIAQIPARYRRNLLITCDGAGATLDLVRHITALNAAPGRRVHYSVGFDLDARGRTAIGQLAETDWDQVLDHRGKPRDPDDAGVAELTGLLRRSAGGDRLATWPRDMRIMCRRERPSAGAQLSLMEEADGWRYQLIAVRREVALVQVR